MEERYFFELVEYTGNSQNNKQLTFPETNTWKWMVGKRIRFLLGFGLIFRCCFCCSVLREVVVVHPVIPPQVLCFHTHFPCSHHVGCAHWAAGGRRSTGARGTGAGGRQTAGRRAGHWRESWAGFFSFPREAGGISSHFKLALYIIPIYLGSGWSNWSDMYNVCTEISIPWVAESTTFF